MLFIHRPGRSAQALPCVCLMSMAALTWARRQSTGSPVAKGLLLLLADYADDSGLCWPSQTTLAREFEASKRTILRTLQSLEAAGLLQRETMHRDDGSRGTDRIRLALGALDGGGEPLTPPGDSLTGGGDTESPGVVSESQGGGDTESPREPSSKPSVGTTLALFESSAPARPAKASPSKRCPADWHPKAEHHRIAAERGLSLEDVDREIANIRDHEFKRSYTDWDAVARKWLRSADPTPAKRKVSRDDARANNLARAFAGAQRLRPT